MWAQPQDARSEAINQVLSKRSKIWIKVVAGPHSWGTPTGKKMYKDTEALRHTLKIGHKCGKTTKLVLENDKIGTAPSPWIFTSSTPS